MSRRLIVIVALFVVSGIAGLECGRSLLAQSTASSTLVLLAPADIKWESGTRPDVTRAALWGIALRARTGCSVGTMAVSIWRRIFTRTSCAV